MNSTLRKAAKALTLAVTFTALAAGSASAEPLITVTEREGIADTGVVVHAGQQVNVDPTADQIWAGVWFTGNNGPAGWTQTASSAYPMPSARKYSLLAKIGSQIVYVGNGKTFTATKSGRVYLQINDDVVNNGSGFFRAYVEAN